MNIFLISIPKSGTNLVDQMIGSMSFNAYVIRDGMWEYTHPLPEVLVDMRQPPTPFVRSHLVHTPDYERVVNQYAHRIFLYRDLRDCLVSSMFWDARTEPTQRAWDVELDDVDKQLVSQMVKWSNVFDKFAGWMDAKHVHKFSYEELISNPEEQSKRLSNIVGGSWQQMMSKFGSRQSNTFRKGKTGEWKKYFKPFHEEMFWERFGGIMTKLGYERECVKERKRNLQHSWTSLFQSTEDSTY